MKIESISLSRWNADTPEPVVLDAAYNLAEYGFFQRGSVKEFLTFATRTLAKRLPAGIHCVEYEGKLCYAFVSAEGLSGIAITDKDYPSRVIIGLLKDLVNEMKTGENATKWRTATVEMSCKITRLESSLATFQDPTKADSLLRVDKSLSETKEVLTKTIEAVLARGEKLDDLVDKSAELSASSKAFYKTAKKTNSCCVMQ